jgi:hypothetical protein
LYTYKKGCNFKKKLDGSQGLSADTPSLVRHLSWTGHNLRPKFDKKKKKAKCYNYEKIGHYIRDCWNPTKMVEKNVNLVIEEEKEAILLLVHDE